MWIYRMTDEYTYTVGFYDLEGTLRGNVRIVKKCKFEAETASGSAKRELYRMNGCKPLKTNARPRHERITARSNPLLAGFEIQKILLGWPVCKRVACLWRVLWSKEMDYNIS